MTADSLKLQVEAMVSRIPSGRVMTYGQIAALCGTPRAARIVGGIAHFGDPALPWHRVVNKQGGLASGYHGGRHTQKEHLEAEGVTVHGTADNFRVDVNSLIWWPATNPILFIVGPTASGKSALAVEVATRLGGEIICADSRTVYKGLDIGTAKPSRDEQRVVPHHLLDVVTPDESFTVADFKTLAEMAIKDISARNKVPIIVGGSGLYIDAVLFDYQFSEGSEARDPNNPRHLAADVPRRQKGIRSDAIVVGLDVERGELKRRIAARVEDMVEAGFVEEVKRARAAYPGSKALDAPGYKAFAQYLDDKIDLETAKKLFARNDAQLAKRQMTWFRRNQHIRWFSSASEALSAIEKLYSAG